MDIYLIRHTKTNMKPGICYGISDVGLSDSFYDEVKIVKNKLSGLKNLEIISSPLKRCYALSKELVNKPFITDSRISEMNFGDWELQDWNNIMTQNGDLYKKWEVNYVNLAPPNGETYRELYTRSSSLLEELLSLKENNFALVTHGGIIRALIAHLLKIPLENAFQLSIDLGSVTKLSINRQLKTIYYINR